MLLDCGACLLYSTGRGRRSRGSLADAKLELAGAVHVITSATAQGVGAAAAVHVHVICVVYMMIMYVVARLGCCYVCYAGT